LHEAPQSWRSSVKETSLPLDDLASSDIIRGFWMEEYKDAGTLLRIQELLLKELSTQKRYDI
jgi:hypothetical protein